jgi:hypothetical protein
MPLKPSYLALLGAGAVVGYSGIRGKGIGSAFRSVLQGQSPKDALAAYTISGTSSAGSTGFSGGIGGQVFSTASGNEASYFTAMLKDIGAPATQANLNTMYTWAKQEEPSFPPPNAWNPLNIKNYITGTFQQWVSPSAGAAGTGAFLEENQYPAIVAALRSGQGLIGNQNPQVASELSAWSGGGYSSIGGGG